MDTDLESQVKVKHPSLIDSPINKALQEEIITYYEVAGPDYAEWSKNFQMHFGYFKWGMNPFRLEPMLEKMNEEALRLLQIPDDRPALVADLGCGLGAVSRYMAKKKTRLFFKGLTIVPWQVAQARKLNFKAGLDSRIEILCEDYSQMSFENDTLDAAFALESSCYAPGHDKKKLIEEIYRVLKPGGRLVIADGFIKCLPEKMPWPVRNIYKKICHCWALPGFAEISLLSKTLDDQGFDEIQVRDISWNIAPSVAYVPKTTLRFLCKELWKNKSLRLKKERWNNVIAPLLGMILGLCRPYFGYYLVSCKKI